MCGVPQLLEADITQADTRDQALVAGRHHGGQLVIEARVGLAGAGQAEVDRRQLIHPQAAEVVFDALAQPARLAGRVVPAARDLAHDRQPARIGGQRFAEQIVDEARAVVLGRIDVVDSSRDGCPEHGDSR